VLVSAGRDALRFAARGTGDTVWLAARDVARLDVARGRRGYAKRGALVGAGLGTLVGTVAALADLGETSCGTVTLDDGTKIGGFFCSTMRGQDVPVYGLAAGLLAAPVGALVGAFVRSERWVPVLLPGAQTRVGSSAMPRPGSGVGLGVSLTFGAP
jgi:hypothetical protein